MSEFVAVYLVRDSLGTQNIPLATDFISLVSFPTQFIGIPAGDYICILRPTLMSLGFVLVMSGIILKSYRIYKIFNNIFAIRTGMRDSVLVRFALLLIVLDVIPIILWFVTNP